MSGARSSSVLLTPEVQNIKCIERGLLLICYTAKWYAGYSSLLSVTLNGQGTSYMNMPSTKPKLCVCVCVCVCVYVCVRVMVGGA